MSAIDWIGAISFVACLGFAVSVPASFVIDVFLNGNAIVKEEK